MTGSSSRRRAWRRPIEGDHARTSRDTSRDAAECVSAPIEMKSTPVSAMARTLARVMPPDASSGTRPATNPTQTRIWSDAHVVEQDPVRARVERLADVVERLGLDLDRQQRPPAPVRRAAAIASAIR